MVSAPLFSVPCPSLVGGRVCGGELYYAIRAVTGGKIGTYQVGVQCGYCGQMSPLLEVRIEERPVIVAVRELPEVRR